MLTQAETVAAPFAGAAVEPPRPSGKTDRGRFFEDFAVGARIRHATPRTVTAGDVSLYTALYGSRFALQSSDEFARSLGYPRAPVDDLLVFHLVFGKTVPDVSINAVANLGYADCRFGVPVYPGDTVATESEVIGVKQNSNGKTGTVYVRSTGRNQHGDVVLEYVRWVMVRKRDPAAAAPPSVVPELPGSVPAGELVLPAGLDFSGYDTALAGAAHVWDDYAPGECIDHVDGMTVEETDHMLATRLYQNTAKVHFDEHAQRDSRFGRRLVYGGHVISLARAFSFNGLANAFKVAAIHAGRHVAPVFAGDTIYAWSRIEARVPYPVRDDVGVLRVRTFATKNQDAAAFPGCGADGRHHADVVLDLDYSVFAPTRARP